MSVSEIVFLIFALFSILIFASIANSLAGGRKHSAWMTGRLYLICLVLYGTVMLATAIALPIEVLPLNEAQYSGDWYIGVSSLRRLPHNLDEDYEVDFRMGNRGTKPINGVKGLIVYLLTEDGTRYDAAPEPSTPPFDAPIDPGKWMITTRKFVMPTNLNRVQLVLVRQGFRLDWFLIGRTPFDGHTVIQLQ